MEELISSSVKKLSTFEFERQNIAGYCKQTFRFLFNIKLIQSKTWFFQFSQWPCWMFEKIQISLHYRILTPILLSFVSIFFAPPPSKTYWCHLWMDPYFAFLIAKSHSGLSWKNLVLFMIYCVFLKLISWKRKHECSRSENSCNTGSAMAQCKM